MGEYGVNAEQLLPGGNVTQGEPRQIDLEEAIATAKARDAVRQQANARKRGLFDLRKAIEAIEEIDKRRSA